MELELQFFPIVSILAGIGILIKPELLNYIIAGYFIALGFMQLLHL